jgi:hypothetical protein
MIIPPRYTALEDSYNLIGSSPPTLRINSKDLIKKNNVFKYNLVKRILQDYIVVALIATSVSLLLIGYGLSPQDGVVSFVYTR